VGKWLAWKVRDGRSVKLGVDLSMGEKWLQSIRETIGFFKSFQYKIFGKFKDVDGLVFWGGRWMKYESLGFENNEVKKWKVYVQNLLEINIILREEEDKLVRDKKSTKRICLVKL